MNYNPNYIEWGQQGWTCPKCGRVYSPSTPMCFYCGRDSKVINTPNTTGVPNDSDWWKDYSQRISGDSKINISKDGSISWEGPVLENISWRDYLDLTTHVWED